jgi:hypothetical protein
MAGAARSLGQAASRIALAAGTLSLCAGPAALAQEAPIPPPSESVIAADAGRAPAGQQVYAPEFFARFAPKTALDMVEQVPGFKISEASEDRGFGQASQNVLINGRRISGKSNDAFGVLQRIGANNVVRIEIVDGATLQIPGLSGQVANVVANVDALSGQWEVQPQFRYTREPSWLNGKASVTGRAGGLQWTLGADAENFHNGASGPERVYDASGAQIDLRDEAVGNAGNGLTLTGGLTYDFLSGAVANLNLQAQDFNFAVAETSLRNPVGRPSEYRIFTNGEDYREYEIGGDYEFALGPGRLKLIGLHHLEEEFDLNTTSVQPSGGATATGQRFSTDAERGESILRGEYGFGALGGELQWSLEGAFNYLDLVSMLEQRQPDGSFTSVTLNDATARVEEKRAETNVTYQRRLSDAWTLQGSLGVEFSQLSQSGIATPGVRNEPREFVRPKGFVALVWAADETLDISFKGERKVGQLDFEDFLASVDLQNESEAAANPELVPDQSWILSVEANKKLGAWGAVKLSAEGGVIEDIVDQIPIGATGQGTGNLDEAQGYKLNVAATLNLDPLGWKGAKIDYSQMYAYSQVDDPLTGESRYISEDEIMTIDATLRWDIPSTPWAAAFGYEQRRYAADVLLNQRIQQWVEPPITYVYVENKDVFGMKARFMVVNLQDTSENLRRDVYVGRRTGPLAFTEDRRWNFEPIFRINLSGTF